MADDEPIDRSKVTFSQAERLAPLPQPLALGELSAEVRNLLWRAFYEELRRCTEHPSMGGHSFLNDPWSKILYDYHSDFLIRSPDEYENRSATQIEIVKLTILEEDWNQVFDFVQFALRHRELPHRFADKISYALRRGRAAYVLVDNDYTIAPAATPEEGATIDRAFQDLAPTGLHGGSAHLRASIEELNNGHFADSVRESVHAVESVARVLAPNSPDSFRGALSALKRVANIHNYLEQGFKNIYGYSSDEDGIRHPMLEDPTRVDQVDAVFMIGACASFISYLIGKARNAGLLDQ